MEPKVSIIMPVYNAERYLSTAIESILKQTYKNFELILVDDGSKDKSPDICNSYAQKDSRVIVIHQRNGGICAARNAGLQASTGEYVTFCDNDDEYDQRLLEKGMEAILREDADIVKYGKKLLYEGKNRNIEKEEFDKVIEGVYDISVVKDCFSSFDRKHFFGFIWDGIYSRELLNKSNQTANEGVALFDEFYKTGYEDVDYNYTIIPFCRKLVCLDECYYVHYIRYGYSTTLKYTYNRVQSMLRVWDKKYQVMTAWKLLTKERVRDDYDLLCMNGEMCAAIASIIWSPSCRLGKNEKMELLCRIANHPLVATKYRMMTKVKAFKISKSRFLVWQLLQWRLYNLVLCIGYLKKRVLDLYGFGSGMQVK